ncbi:LapA family protein [Gracilinema caldarium]|uniref:LapA family protein n=1 Tax=Gracilinema caldarium TaxID=215591 RepID=UPI00350E5676
MIIFILLLILITIFASQNTAFVSINFLNFTVNGSLSLVLLITFVFGFLSGVIFLLPSYIRKSIKKTIKNEAIQKNISEEKTD